MVCNPSKVDSEQLRALVETERAQNGWATTVWFETASDDDGRRAVVQALEAAPSVILVAGGDGTLRMAAEVLHGSGIPIGLIAAGTGNLLARNLRLPIRNLQRAVQIAFTGVDRPIDVGFVEYERADASVDSHAFVVMGGIGVDANMAANTSSVLKKRVGWLAYVGPILSSIFSRRDLAMEYTTAGRPPRSTNAHTVIVGNCGTINANILLIPDAEIDDGLLDIVILRPRHIGSWFQIAGRLIGTGILRRTPRGRTISDSVPALSALRYFQTSAVGVRFETPQEVELDGDTFGSVIGARVSVEHHGLSVRVLADPATQ